ncbi:MAG: ribonuclease T2, partial [Gammaproteobacteria bacterium]
RKLSKTVTLPASLIEQAFVKDNADLTPDGVTVTCKAGHIQEARICLTRDLEFRACGRDAVRDCTLTNAQFDPMR